MEWSPKRLQHWLSEHLNVEGDITVAPIDGAMSNENYSIDWGYKRWLLRKMPSVLSHQSAHNVLREFRILKALENTSVRTPNIVIACDDRSIIGTPFYIMERISGVAVHKLFPPTYGLSDDCIDVLTIDMINTLAALHCVDWRALNLSDIGRTKDCLEQHVRRWQAQHQALKSGEFSSIVSISTWLTENLPEEHEVVIIHGDYQLNNLIISRQPPARLLAVVDWELTTLGSPLMDLASAMLFWPAKGNNFAPPLLAGGKVQRGTRTFKQVAQLYAETTQRDISSLNYYLVFAAWKRAIILESRCESHQHINDKSMQFLEDVKSTIKRLLDQANFYIKRPICF